MCICVCATVRIYMFICSELIEEAGRSPGLIFGMWGYLWSGSDKFESWDFFHTFDKVMTYCHIFQGVKNHINAYISHPMRDRNMKT